MNKITSMKSIFLMSFKPKYSDLILNKEKHLEFRKRIPKRLTKNSKVLVYSSSPTKELVGEFEVSLIEILPIKDLWEVAVNVPGENIHAFHEYYKNKSTGTLIKITNARKYDSSISLKSLREMGIEPPMSSMEVTNTTYKEIIFQSKLNEFLGEINESK